MEAAVAAGVLLCLVPESTLMLQRASMLSVEGRSKTLDASADGYVRGETCKAVYLRPAGRVKSDALGLVMASAVNTNGRASSLTAPNGPSQQALLREALAVAAVRPAEVDGLQMHSNGTSLGDPIEVGGISAVLLVSPACKSCSKLMNFMLFETLTSRRLVPFCRRGPSAGRHSFLQPPRATPGTRSLAQAWPA